MDEVEECLIEEVRKNDEVQLVFSALQRLPNGQQFLERKDCSSKPLHLHTHTYMLVTGKDVQAVPDKSQAKVEVKTSTLDRLITKLSEEVVKTVLLQGPHATNLNVNSTSSKK